MFLLGLFVKKRHCQECGADAKNNANSSLSFYYLSAPKMNDMSSIHTNKITLEVNPVPHSMVHLQTILAVAMLLLGEAGRGGRGRVPPLLLPTHFGFGLGKRKRSTAGFRGGKGKGTAHLRLQRKRAGYCRGRMRSAVDVWKWGWGGVEWGGEAVLLLLLTFSYREVYRLHSHFPNGGKK